MIFSQKTVWILTLKRYILNHLYCTAVGYNIDLLFTVHPLVLLFGGALENQEAAPMEYLESFSLVRDRKLAMDAFCDIALSRNFVYRKFFIYLV